VDVDDFGLESGGDDRPDPVDAGQAGPGVGDQGGDLLLEGRGLGIDREDPVQSAPGDLGPDSGVVGQ
jgi:hypothetical protein